MTDSITPPPELVQQWVAEIWHEGTPVRVSLSDEHIATRAAQWSADQELEACVKWLNSYMPGKTGDQLLRPFRRPMPQSLKEQALADLREIYIEQPFSAGDSRFNRIRRALEALGD